MLNIVVQNYCPAPYYFEANPEYIISRANVLV